MDAVDYWRENAQRCQSEVWAACRAIGAAGYYLGPYGPSTDSERLACLREVIAELRTALGLDDVGLQADSRDAMENGREL